MSIPSANRCWFIFAEGGMKSQIQFGNIPLKQLLHTHSILRALHSGVCTICTHFVARFCPVSSWRHLLFGIRCYCFVFFIRYWKIESRCARVLALTYHLLFASIVYSWCLVVFIDNLRTRKLRVREFNLLIKLTKRTIPVFLH